VKKLKKCPICGDTQNVKIGRSITNRWKRWSMLCNYCGFVAEGAHTKRGAIRKWNKSTNVVDVRKQVGER